ncbi:MAG: DUF3027 domain-containing protein [Actinomycetota bacterium]|nr:DUF3027 domain-containing protein [Actinomycetota bacterium]
MPTSTAVRAPDAVCAAAVDLARTAAADVAEGPLGEYVGLEADGERLVTHYFAAGERGYVGWRWSVTVARAPRAKDVTVCEMSLLPGPDALLAPEWLPWSERLRPGDLGVGDMLPTAADDDRLVPAYVAVDETPADAGLDDSFYSRIRVMSRLGRLEAAERWYEGDRGPEAPIAKSAPARCGTCGFYLQLAGSLQALFGVCGNEFAPDDAMVVAADHGCGAHSEALVEASAAPEPGPPMDDAEIEVLAVGPLGAVDDPDSESLGHS